MGCPIVDGSAAGLRKSGHLPSICPRSEQTLLPTFGSLARNELVWGLRDSPYQNFGERLGGKSPRGRIESPTKCDKPPFRRSDRDRSKNATD